MAIEPKLNVYQIQVISKDDKDKSNRLLFKYITKQATDSNVKDESLILDLLKYLLKALDNKEMFSDPKSRKTMTANQANIADSNVNASIIPYSEQFIIDGTLEVVPTALEDIKFLHWIKQSKTMLIKMMLSLKTSIFCSIYLQVLTRLS